MKVDILLSFYKGEQYIDDQVESILNQDAINLSKLLIRNDGEYSKKLTEFKNESINVIQGENLGVKYSFFELIKQSNNDSSYFAFCDQDDVWKKDKVKTAIDMLNPYQDVPAMYFSKAMLVDDKLSPIGLDTFEDGVFDFERTLIKNNAIGCTIIFNKKLRDILKSRLPNYNCISESFLHDHLLYALCSGIGGKIIFDATPHIYYRQHQNNVVGNRTGLIKKIRANGIFNTNRVRSSWAKELYSNFSDVLAPNNKILLENIINYRSNWKIRLILMRNKKFSKSIIEKMNISLLFLLGKF
ncbi:glycosyltransferase [Enterococcus asini]|uniref:glycosyltransferase n=1 Tax=Enterococcus asini TaxID=57732 RepID=UPI0032BF9CCD